MVQWWTKNTKSATEVHHQNFLVGESRHHYVRYTSPLPGLLQLSFVQHHWQLTSTTAVCTERCARLIKRTGRCKHISPVLQELHWLPVRRHVDFKLATLVFKSLQCCAPSYLSDACKTAPEVSRHLHLSGTITCVIPWSRTRLGDRSFDVAGLRLWNKLPASMRSSDNLCQFRRQLKTFFVKD